MNDNTLKSGSLLKNGEYRITGVLGQGGFGITYEAEQVSLGRKVAVKEFFMKDICNRDEATSHVSVPSVGSKELVERFRQKFIREAKMIAGLDHEHIVKIFDVFEENGTAYYVMEFLGGGSLDRKIKDKGAMSEKEAVGFIRQIADALEYLHSQNILHFDVKPSNVLLGKNGSAKLIDFGISKRYDEAGVQTSSTPIGISKGFAPLEQYKQGSDINSFTPATDVYALGATLYALLSGTNPPEASDVNDDGLPVIDAVSPAVMRAIEKAMQPRRKDRLKSVAEFLAILDGTVREDDDEHTVVPVSESVQAPKDKYDPQLNLSAQPIRKPFPKWLYGLIAGVLVAVLAVVLINRSDKAFLLDNLQIDSTSVVAEAKPEKPVTSNPSSSASKPETPAKQEVPSVIELKSISLSKTALELEEGSSATLMVKYSPNNATDKATTWKSSNSSVAKVGTNGKVIALMAGSATIVAKCGDKDAYCNVTVKAKEVQPSKPEQVTSQTVQSSSATTGIHAGHEWVDLGLSVKWATCNVGASTASDYGSYFAWGETSPKSSYDWENLKYRTSGDSYDNVKFSKYVTDSIYGPVDNKTKLDLSDDAARANWGGSWRMPTLVEFHELREKCTWTWTTMNGKSGYKFISKSNGNSIFLPAAGYKSGSYLDCAGSYGYYWPSSPETGYDAYLFYFDSCIVNWGYNRRYIGQSVRPVCP